MATKPKTPKTTAAAKAATADALTRTAADKACEDEMTAHVMTNGQCNAVVVQQYLHYVNGGRTVRA